MPSMLCPTCWGAPPSGAACGGCNGATRIDDVQLTTNFALSELLQSPTAVRKGIANTPTAQVITNLAELTTKLLQPLRSALGPMKVNSGYRAPLLNAAIGGSSSSAHMEGHAADLDPKDKTLKETVIWLRDSGLEFDQVIFEGTWVHAGWRKDGLAKPRREVLMMFGGKYFPFDENDPRVG
jgi:hypothetical protein